MRFSLRWLRDYAALDSPVATISRALTDTGTEVGAVEIGGEGIVVARIAAVSPVPGSSHLQFADIDLGSPVPAALAAFTETTGTVRVMTGAPNVNAGQLVPYAPPGTRPPAMDERLGVKTIRGHKSPGMLCSAIELGVGEDADGILILEDGTPGQAVGEVLDLDTVLDLDVTTNRPDCLCHVGIARELAAALGETLAEPPAEVPDDLLSATSAELRASVRVEDPQGCPRFAVRVIEGIAVGPSPPWLRNRLRSVGLRPINNVVDVTNFMTHELGQPMHAFDLDRFIELGGTASAEVVVRRATDGEHVVDLLGTDRELSSADMIVCSGPSPASIAGVIGGATTAVTDSTRSVLLEAATWDGPTIRATSKRLGLRTDASTLFEKGLSDRLPPVALGRAAALIAELSGGHVLRGVIEDWPRRLPELGPIELTASFAGRLLGIPIDATEIATTLAQLGFAVEQSGSTLSVMPPYFRRDVSLPEDLVEEVGRMIGYARVPSTLPGRRAEVTTTSPAPPVEDGVRETCLGAGFDEAITFSFVGPSDATLLPGLGRARTPIPVRNPLSDEWSVMRTSQLPRLCAALAGNVNRGNADVMLFELGRVFWEGEREGLAPGSTPDGADRDLPALPLEPLLLSVAIHVASGSPDDAAIAVRRVQSLLDRLVVDLAGESARVEPTAEVGLHAGRSAGLSLDGAGVGLIGELSYDTTAAFEIRGRVAVGELRIDAVVPSTPRRPRFVAPPRFPAIVQDLAVTVGAERAAGEAMDAIREAQEPLLENAELYDEYRGGSLGAGRKGWTFRLTFRAADRTLTGEEAQTAQRAIAAALATRCDAEIRQ
ncbi:MAG TPA: phenylalanine--tRNA ligase subunit beta [Candidatus Acidoferrales bacterium]|nr:phenylalanine--tRNA ligase subunit beta [Candidatus Acidoferrales bacterium]